MIIKYTVNLHAFMELHRDSSETPEQVRAAAKAFIISLLQDPERDQEIDLLIEPPPTTNHCRTGHDTKAELRYSNVQGGAGAYEYCYNCFISLLTGNDSRARDYALAKWDRLSIAQNAIDTAV